LNELFNEYDSDKDGSIGVAELEKMLVELGVAPMKDPSKVGSASSDKPKAEVA
jgi:Ca2+-binding EF-hand superfamily protein